MKKKYMKYLFYCLVIVLIVSSIICGTILERNRYHGEVKILDSNEFSVEVYNYIHKMSSYYTPFNVIGFAFMLYVTIDLLKYLLHNYRGQSAQTLFFVILTKVGAIILTYYGYTKVSTAEMYLHSTGKIITPLFEILIPFLAAIIIIILVNLFIKKNNERIDKDMESSPNIKNRINWNDYTKK